MTTIHVPQIKQFDVGWEAGRVRLLFGGRLVTEMPWEAALALAKALMHAGRRAEEFVKANAIIEDQAILIRRGIPLGLSSNPDILAEAEKEAAWNSDLRRYIPSGIESQEAVGSPTVIKHEPEASDVKPE